MANTVKKVTVEIETKTKGAANVDKAFDGFNKKARQSNSLIKELDSKIAALKIRQTFATSEKELRNVNKQLEDANKKMKRLNEVGTSQGGIVGKLNSAFGTLGKTIIAAFAIQRVVSFGKESLSLYKIQLKAEQELLRAVRGREDVQNRLLFQARQLQKVTLFGDEQIIQAQSLIAAFVQEEDRIKELTRLTLDLATAKRMDLATAGDLITKTFASSTNALSRYGIVVEGNAGSTQRLDSLTTQLDKSFKGAAETAGKTDPYTQLGNSFADLQEKIGKLIDKRLSPLAKFLKIVVDSFQTVEEIQEDVFNANLERQVAATVKEFKEGSVSLESLTTNLLSAEDRYAATREQLFLVNEQYAVLRKRLKEAQQGSGESISAIEREFEANNKIKKSLEETLRQRSNQVKIVKAEIDAINGLIDAKNKDAQNDRLLDAQRALARADEMKSLDDEVPAYVLNEEAKRKASEELFDALEKEYDGDLQAWRDAQEEKNMAFFAANAKLIEGQSNFSKALNESWDEIAQAANQIFFDQIQARLDEQLNELQENQEKRSELITTQYDSELQKFEDLNANKKISDEQLARQRELIAKREAEAQQKLKEEFAKKEAELKRKQAINDKLGALFSIAINTAEAVVKLLETPPLAIAAGIAGAAQAAVVAARPIPKFAKGKKAGERAGLSIVGEQGQEAMYVPDSATILTNRETKQNEGILKAIQNKRLDEFIVNNYADKMVLRPDLGSLAENLARSIKLHNEVDFNDSNIVRHLRKNKNVSINNASEIGREIAKQMTRQDRYNKFYGRA